MTVEHLYTTFTLNFQHWLHFSLCFFIMKIKWILYVEIFLLVKMFWNHRDNKACRALALPTANLDTIPDISSVWYPEHHQEYLLSISRCDPKTEEKKNPLYFNARVLTRGTIWKNLFYLLCIFLQWQVQSPCLIWWQNRNFE